MLRLEYVFQVTRDDQPLSSLSGQATFNDVVDFRDCTALNAGRLLCMSVAYTEEGAGPRGGHISPCLLFVGCSVIHLMMVSTVVGALCNHNGSRMTWI